MGGFKPTRLLVTVATCVALVTPLALLDAGAQSRRGRGWQPGWQDVPAWPREGRRPPRGYQEPAYARGYSDGFTRGQSDGRDRDRYDPVGSRDYRNGDNGYFGRYGSRDAYRNNYRAGFRQGYEEGYRYGARYRR
jgi:hypothetical protein